MKVFYLNLVVSIALIVGGFFVPPVGVIDGSVLTAVGLLLMFSVIEKIPEAINYEDIKGLRLEAIQKLSKLRPMNVGQAGRISGVSPADINVLLVYMEAHKHDFI